MSGLPLLHRKVGQSVLLMQGVKKQHEVSMQVFHV